MLRAMHVVGERIVAGLRLRHAGSVAFYDPRGLLEQ